MSNPTPDEASFILQVSATETDGQTWETVRQWALTNGYDIGAANGRGRLPVHQVTWYDAVKWCNARSERSGVDPVYFTDENHQHVYRTGQRDLSPAHVAWSGRGFRLPTEREWEFACRAGTTSRYYWGTFERTHPINRSYAASHQWGYDEVNGNPLPVAGRKPNAFGLYDMSGNVDEWCWDWWNGRGQPDAEEPLGPRSGFARILKGGGFGMDRTFASADRHVTAPGYRSLDAGFRIVTRHPDPPSLPPETEERRIRPASAPVSEPAAIAIFDLLKPDDPRLDEAWLSLRQGDAEKALSAWRDVFLASVTAAPLQTRPLPDGGDAVRRWRAWHRKGEPMQFFGPGQPRHRNWLGDARELAGAAAADLDGDAIDIWSWMISEYATRHKRQFDALTIPERQQPTVEGGADPAWFERSIGMGGGQGLRWLDMLHDLLRAQPAIADRIPPDALAHLARMIVEDDIPLGLVDSRSPIPNQFIGNAIGLMMQACILDMFRDAGGWEAAGILRMEQALQSHMPDGANLEASLNYTWGVVDKIDAVLPFYASRSIRPPWMDQAEDVRDGVIRMYTALLMPNGAIPSIGNLAYSPARASRRFLTWDRVHSLPDLHAAVNAVYRNSGDGPGMTSTALPYAGYYVMRNGWKQTHDYLLLQAGRPGAGHAHADSNAIHLYADGRHWLIDGGPASYGPGPLPDHQKSEYLAFNRLLRSSRAANTVVVDDRSQVLQGKADPLVPYTEPAPNRWYAGIDVDYAEGVFDGIYRDDTEEGVPAVHYRQVLYLKPMQAWAVIDTVIGGESAEQLWHLPPPCPDGVNDALCPGIAAENVLIDSTARTVRVRDHLNRQLTLRHAGSARPHYRTRFGETEPLRGWSAIDGTKERLPTVQISAAWPTGVPLVTLIATGDGGELEETTTGEELELVWQRRGFRCNLRIQAAESTRPHLRLELTGQGVRTEAVLPPSGNGHIIREEQGIRKTGVIAIPSGADQEPSS